MQNVVINAGKESAPSTPRSLTPKSRRIKELEEKAARAEEEKVELEERAARAEEKQAEFEGKAARAEEKMLIVEEEKSVVEKEKAVAEKKNAEFEEAFVTRCTEMVAKVNLLLKNSDLEERQANMQRTLQLDEDNFKTGKYCAAGLCFLSLGFAGIGGLALYSTLVSMGVVTCSTSFSIGGYAILSSSASLTSCGVSGPGVAKAILAAGVTGSAVYYTGKNGSKSLDLHKKLNITKSNEENLRNKMNDFNYYRSELIHYRDNLLKMNKEKDSIHNREYALKRLNDKYDDFKKTRNSLAECIDTILRDKDSWGC